MPEIVFGFELGNKYEFTVYINRGERGERVAKHVGTFEDLGNFVVEKNGLNLGPGDKFEVHALGKKLFEGTAAAVKGEGDGPARDNDPGQA